MRRKRNLAGYQAVKERSCGVCERCKSQEATAVHHRRLRSQGGSDALINLAHLCYFCHTHIHAHPAESYEAGWLISPKVHGSDVARLYEVEDGSL